MVSMGSGYSQHNGRGSGLPADASTSGALDPTTPPDHPTPIEAEDEEWRDDEGISKLPPPEWLVEGMIPAGEACVIYGEESSFKTFLALDLALAVATGGSWLGHTIPKSQRGSVLYIAAEGGGGLKPRVAAWKRHHHYKGWTPHIRYKLTATVLPDKDRVSNLIRQIQDRMGPSAEESLKLIVVDTLSRCYGGYSERDQDAMAYFVPQVDRLAHTFNATVLLIHHTGWSPPATRQRTPQQQETESKESYRPRGPRKLVSDLGTIISVRRVRDGKIAPDESTLVRIHCWKQRELDKFPDFDARMIEVETSIPAKPTSLVPVLATGSEGIRVTLKADPMVKAIMRLGEHPFTEKAVVDANVGVHGFSGGTVSRHFTGLVQLGVLREVDPPTGEKGKWFDWTEEYQRSRPAA